MLPLWACAGGGALLAGVLAGWTVRDWKADSDALEAKDKAFEQYAALTNELADQSLRYEYTVQDLRANEYTDREIIREVYRNVEVSADCAVPDAAARVLDNAVNRTNAAAAGEPGGEVSRAP